MSLIERDARVIWHPFTQAAVADAPLAVGAADGVHLVLESGARVFDAVSSWWTILHRHGHPHIVEAIARQARTLDHVLFAGCTHEPAVRLAERLTARAPAGLTRVFYTDDGSTAVEASLKIAYQARANAGAPERTLFVALEGGYHGDTFGAMSAGVRDLAGPFDPFFFRVERVPVAAGRIDLVAAAALFAREAHRVCALIVEPILQGAGGMRTHPADDLRALAALARAAGATIIADEVMTGFGRTGRFFACEHAMLQPDLLCTAKALTGGTLPLAAVLTTEALYEAFVSTDRRKTFLHGHSYTANPIACAAALANLTICDADPPEARARAIEALWRTVAPAFAAHPRVTEVRVCGAVLAVELRGDARGYFADDARALARRCIARGYLIRPLGNVAYVLPPLESTPEQLTDCAAALLDELG